MSRFSVVYEDPEYDDDLTWEDDETHWEDKFSEWEANQGVAEKPQSSDQWQQIEDPHLVDI